MAGAETVEDHVDEFFVDLVLMGLARELRLVLVGLNAAFVQQASPPRSRIEELYLRLTWIFNVSTETFERKKYASLSHEANKAMNLNAYISPDGAHLAARRPPPTAWSCARCRPASALTTDANHGRPDTHLPADARRRLAAAARLLPPAGLLPGIGRQRARRGDPDAVLFLPRCPHPHRAGRRGHHRHPAHPAPGHDLLRRDVLGGRQRRHPQARPGGHRRGGGQPAASRSGPTSRTERSSRTPSRASTSASTAGPW